MPSWDLLGAFFAAAFVFAVMPGPGLLYTAAQTMARGARAGWMAVIGINVGGWVHVIAAAFGLALLFQAVPWVYATLKIAGAIYLIYLGAKLIFFAEPIVAEEVDLPARSPSRAFWQSVTVEVLNPKTALFFLAFLPQFTDPSAALPLWLQLFILGAIVNVMFSLADAVAVVVARQVRDRLSQSGRGVLWAQRVGGGVLVGLGARLALSRA